MMQVFTPHDYQTAAINLVLRNPNLALFLEMGLGKTVITLSAIAEMKQRGAITHPVLIIAPLQVARHTWATEAMKWEHTHHLRVASVVGRKADREKALLSDADIYVVNRENAKWLMEYAFLLTEAGEKRMQFDMLVIDELSGYKSSDTPSRFKPLKAYRHNFKRIVGLTGTPSPNGLAELWSQMYIIDGGETLYSNEYRFMQQFFIINRDKGFPVITQKRIAETEIPKRIEKNAFSLKASDYLNLPKRIDLFHTASPSPSEAKVMKEKLREYLTKMRETGQDDMTMFTKAMQIANGAIYDADKQVHILSDVKLSVMEELVESAKSPCIAFYTFKHDAERIKKRFGDACRELKTTQDIIDWNEGKIEIFLLHPASAGHGLNLQAGGNTIIWFGLTYSLELYQQANARLHRQGQTKPVTINHIIAENSIDGIVIDALQRKGETQDTLMKSVRMNIDKLLE